MRATHASLSGAIALSLSIGSAAAACRFAEQGDGHVAGIIDARSFRLSDGAEVRLAGIEPVAGQQNAVTELTALIGDRDVTLHGDSDTPDRYGRQPAFVFADPALPAIQVQMLAQGMVLNAASVSDRACAAEMVAAEASARQAKRGIWAQTNVIKNTESPGDILADVGRFALVEGRVLSVRQAGTVTYINFGRRWTQDFAVTISRRMMVAFEAAGIAPKSFERRRIRVRGWIERRGGPRIEALRVGQIEVVGDN
jgi:endonuclease YncB( thermonuclease family)